MGEQGAAVEASGAASAAGGFRPFVPGEERARSAGRRGGLASGIARQARKEIRQLLEGGLEVAVRGLLEEIGTLKAAMAKARGGGSKSDRYRLAWLYSELGKLCKVIVPVSIQHSGRLAFSVPPRLPAPMVAALRAQVAAMEAAGELGPDGLPILEGEYTELPELPAPDEEAEPAQE